MATRRDADGFNSKSTPELDTAALAPFIARLGDTPDRLLEWVVNFAERDLSSIGPGERQDLSQDLWALPAIMWPSKGWRPQSHPMAEPELLELQGQLRDGLHRFVRGAWGIRGHIIIGLMKHPKTGRPRVGIRSTPTGFEDGGVIAGVGVIPAVVELLCQVGVGDRLRICPARDCGRVFIGYRKQRFCSTEHAQQERNDRFYKKKKGVRKVNHFRKRKPA